VKCIENAGLAMDYMILEPIASAQAVLDEEEKEAGVVLVDIGGGTTDIAIFKENKIQHTAVIPFGGNIITEDICAGCSIIRHYAEEVKVKFGSALAEKNRDDEVVSIPGIKGHAAKEISFKNLASIIQSRLEEIFELVNMEIQKARSDNKLIAGIVLTGGGAMMKHIQQLAEFSTGMEVRIGHPDEHLAQGTPKDMVNPMYSTGIGLVIETLGRMDHDERLRLAQKTKEDEKKLKKQTVETVEIDPSVEGKTEDDEDFGFGKKIITRLSELFKPDNIK